MGYFIRKLLTINKAKSLGTEEFFFSIFSNGYQQEKKITPLVERLFFFDALWWICHDWTSEYITEHQNISHVVYQWSNMYLYGTVIHWYSLIAISIHKYHYIKIMSNHGINCYWPISISDTHCLVHLCTYGYICILYLIISFASVTSSLKITSYYKSNMNTM